MSRKYFVLYNEESGQITGFKVSSSEPETTFIEVTKDQWQACFTKRALYKVEEGALVLKEASDEIIDIDDFEQRKVQILCTLKSTLQSSVYEVYPAYKQTNISLGLLGEEAKEELESFLESILTLYKVTKEYIESLEEIEDLKQIDIKELENVFRDNISRLINSSEN